MYNKTLAPRETVSFVSPRPSRVSGKQNSVFPLGPVIKCFQRFNVLCLPLFKLYHVLEEQRTNKIRPIFSLRLTQRMCMYLYQAHILNKQNADDAEVMVLRLTMMSQLLARKLQNRSCKKTRMLLIV